MCQLLHIFTLEQMAAATVGKTTHGVAACAVQAGQHTTEGVNFGNLGAIGGQ